MKRRNFLKIQRHKEHKEGKFANPYFKHRRIKRVKRARIITAVLLLLIVATPIVVIASPLYRITTVDISGLTTIPSRDIEGIVEGQMQKKRLGVFSQRNRLFFHQDQLYQTLIDTYQFSSLELTVKRNTVHIVAEEKISEIVWASNNVFYFLDLDGIVVRELFDVEQDQIHKRLGLPPVQFDEGPDIVLPPTIPIIFDDSQSEVLAGTNPINPVLVQHVIDFDKAVRQLLIHPKTYGLEAPGTPWMRVDTDMPYDILFDGTQDVEGQVSMLRSVLQDNDNLEILEYIDLRFGNRIFVK